MTPIAIAYQTPLVHGILQARILEQVAIPFSRGPSQPRDWIRISCIAGGFFTTELPGKSTLIIESENESHSVLSDSLQPNGLYNSWNSSGHNTGVGSLSLLQGIFPIQGSNPGLPHCRLILYQLSHKGNILISVTPYNWGISFSLCLSSLASATYLIFQGKSSHTSNVGLLLPQYLNYLGQSLWLILC